MPNATRRLPKSLMKSTSSFTASTLPAQGGRNAHHGHWRAVPYGVGGSPAILKK